MTINSYHPFRKRAVVGTSDSGCDVVLDFSAQSRAEFLRKREQFHSGERHTKCRGQGAEQQGEALMVRVAPNARVFEHRCLHFSEELRSAGMSLQKVRSGIGIGEHDGVAAAFRKMAQREGRLRVRAGSRHELPFGQTVKMMIQNIRGKFPDEADADGPRNSDKDVYDRREGLLLDAALKLVLIKPPQEL